MPKHVTVLLPDELYEKLEAIAGLLGLTKSSVLKLLLRAVDYREEGDQVVILSRGVVGMRRIKGFITADEYAGLKAEAEAAQRLRERLEVLGNRLREIEKRYEHCVSALETCWRIQVAGRRPEDLWAEPSYVAALREHGLLSLAKRFFTEGDKTILEYLVGDDAVQALYMYRDQILAARDGETRRKKKMTWIF